MKFGLIIALIALVSAGSNDYSLDVLECILKNEKIYDQAIKFIEAIKTEDMSTIISTFLSSYEVLKEVITECTQEKPSVRALDEVKPIVCANQERYDKCRANCKGMLHMICKKDCYNCWCL